MSVGQQRALRALARGPLYRPTLQLVLGLSAGQTFRLTATLVQEGLIEVAEEIGPDTYRITDAGREVIS